MAKRSTYDADGERLTRTANGVTTVYVAGLYEEDRPTGTTRALYPFNGQIIAQRSSDATGLIYLHGDHLGSVSLATNSSGAVVSRQDFDPWGAIRSGGIPQTALNYTGQRRDATGLLYYHARYYDPGLGRFLSADSVVPGIAEGKGGVAVTLGVDSQTASMLTVDFHEPQFVTMLATEHRFTQQHGFRFQLDSENLQAAKDQWGPRNPQALNRYSYVLNNPIRYVDPTGHNPAALGLFALGLSAPVVTAIIVAVGATIILGCISDVACRSALSDLVASGYDNVKGFVDKLTHVLESKKFKGGSQSRRDKNYGITDKAFWDWWHRVGKKQAGGQDLSSKEEAEEAYEDWVEQGRPRGPKGGKGDRR